VNQFRELIKATSQDNVQSQALLAAEALGAGLSVSDKLLGKAVDALAGQQNVKLQNMKIAVGLFSGGTASMLRTSTPGLKVFLLITGLKMWHHDDDVGDILYNMAVSCGVLRAFPASGYQFQQLVSAISGHSLSLIPAQHLHHVGQKILDSCVPAKDRVLMARLSQLIPTTSFSDLLALVFTGLQDKSIRTATLHGDYSGIWICALLTWLLPDETSVLKSGEIVIGHGKRISIHLAESEDSNRSWEYLEWKAEEPSLRSLVSSAPPAHIRQMLGYGGSLLQRMGNSNVWIPWLSCKNYIQSTLARSPSIVIVTIGQIAQSFVKMAVRDGKVHGRVNLSAEKEMTSVLDISSEFFVGHHESFLTQFGWTTEELEDGQFQFWHEFERRWGSAREASARRTTSFTKGVISTVYGRSLHTEQGDFTQDAIDLAIHVAVEALSALTYHPNKTSERKYLPNMNFTSYSFRENFLEELWSHGGMHIEKFQSTLLKIVLSTATELRGDELILENNGMVVVLGSLLDPSMKQSHACALDLFPGIIKKDDHRYKTVRQMITGGTRRSSGKPLQPFQNGEYTGLVEPITPPSRYYDLEFFSTLKGQEILIRPVIQFHKSVLDLPEVFEEDDYEMLADSDLDWIRASQNLATAKHLGRFDQCTRITEERLGKTLFEDRRLDHVVWMDAKFDQAEDETGGRKLGIISCTRGDNLLRLYQLSLQRNCFYVVQNDGSLIKALMLAATNYSDWVIIM
jgi:hypothetical protein